MASDQNETHIIGWGLAGATLAWQLHFNNRKFVVHDSGYNHSTRIAAGIANPIVFKRLTKTWNIDLLLPFAIEFYNRTGELVSQKLVSEKCIYYPFTNTEDENNWSAKMGDDRFSKYIEHAILNQIEHVYSPFGFGKVNTFGNLDTCLFMDLSKAFFLNQGIRFIQEKTDYTIAEKNPEHDFVFCEGIDVIHNPLFNHIPMKTSHGEVLVIEAHDLNFEDVISKNLFILPLGNHRFKIGATYNWELKEPIQTDLGKADLIERLENLIDCPYTIISHQAGIRPTVADRRPLLGVHPNQKNAYIFNGLGTKGVLLAPFYAAHFTDFYLSGVALNPEVNCDRFHKRFRNQNL